MVLDTSAILAVLQDEPERQKFNEAIEQPRRARCPPRRLLNVQ